MPYPYTWEPNHVVPATAAQVKVVKRSTGAAAVLTTPVSITDGVISFTLTDIGTYTIIVSAADKRETGTFTVDPTNVDNSTPEFITVEFSTAANSGGGFINYPPSTLNFVTKAQLDDPDSDVRESLDQSLDLSYIRIPPNGIPGEVLLKSGSSAAADYVFWGKPTFHLPINVKTDFAAVGDGIADDTAAIQNALDAVPVGGGAVYIPRGRYKISAQLQVKQDATRVFGDGAANNVAGYQFSTGTRLEATSAVTGSVLLVQPVANNRPLQGITLHDFTIDGGLAGTNITGITFRSNQGHMERVNIWRMSGTGLRVQGYTAPAWDTYDSTFTNVLVGDCVGSGVFLDLGSADTHWSHCVFLTNQDNLVIKGSSGQFTSCHFYDPIRHNIWFDGGGSRTKFVNAKIEGLKNDMVLIDSANGGYSDIQFTGCGFSTQTSGIPDNTYDYVKITGPSGIGIGRTTFVGNSFNLKGGSTLKARYAINLDTSAVQNTVILANSFGPPSHWGTAAIRNAGSTSLPATIRANANVIDDIASASSATSNFTLTPLNANTTIDVNSATTVNVTVPLHATAPMPIGTVIKITQIGLGQVAVAPTAGVTLNTARSLTTRARYSVIELRKRFDDTWVVSGDLT